MSVCTLNKTIKSYCDFFDKLYKYPSDSDIQKSLAAVEKYYSNYKKEESNISEIKKYYEKLHTDSAYDILLSFEEPEQSWAYVHLMIETVEGRTLNLWKRIRSFSDINSFQKGMGKLWSKGHKTVYTVML